MRNPEDYIVDIADCSIYFMDCEDGCIYILIGYNQRIILLIFDLERECFSISEPEKYFYKQISNLYNLNNMFMLCERIREEMERLLLFAFVNNNHISNVKMLQSIYKQDYENIVVVICNDCTDGFQSERLLYNFNACRTENIRQVYFQENPYPQGEFLSLKLSWSRVEADYIMILHSGECFTSPQALRNGVKYLEYDDSAAAVIAPVEQWSDDSKNLESVYIPANRNTITVTNQLLLPEEDIRDCMVLYRMSVLRNLDIEIAERQTHISRKLLPTLLERKEAIMVLSTSFCRFSSNNIKDVFVPIPNTYGNVKLQRIDELLKIPSVLIGQGSVQRAIHQTKKRNYNVLLYRFSRFQKLKAYAVLDLLLMICAACLIMTGVKFLAIVASVLFAVTVLLSIWIAAMLICNLYFKKYPQRLVWDNE